MEEIEIKFSFNEEITKMKCKRKEQLRDIFKRYIINTKKNKEKIDFFYNKIKINEELKLEDINKSDNYISIIVKENKKINGNHIIYSKDIICPICKKSCIIDFNDYKIITRCIENKSHKKEMVLNDFISSQKRNEKKSCNSCRSNREHLNDNKFYSCLKCKMNLCSQCKSSHNNEEHIVIDYNLVNYKCEIHDESFVSYCEDCEKNLCTLCEDKHNINHKIIGYDELIPDYNVREKLIEFRRKKNKFISELKSIIDIINYVINNISFKYIS